MLRYFLAICFTLPAAVGAADLTIGIADQHKAALDIDDGRLSGSLAQVFQCPLDRIGLEFDIVSLPHARVLLQLQRGEIDVAMPLVRLDRRDQYAVFARSLLPVEFALFSKTPIDPAKDLSGYSFTALRSTASVDLVLQRKGKVIEVSGWAQALELARRGRYDGAVIPLATISDLPEENFEGLKQTDFGWLPIGYYISRAIVNTDGLLEQFNAAIDACKS